MTPQSAIDVATSWSSIDPNEKTASFVNELIRKSSSSEDDLKTLKSLFPTDGSRIGFGTAGLRAGMLPGPLGMNDLVIIQATQGLAKYCMQVVSDSMAERREPKKLVAVIGYDHRSKAEFGLSSKSFALLAKLVFVQAGFDCILLDGFVPTPLVAYSTSKLGAAVGVMITASHNPKNDAGYKVYWSDGCQIRAPLDQGIADCINQNLEPWVDYKELLQSQKDKFKSKGGDNGCFGLSNSEDTKSMAHSYYEAIQMSGLITGQGQIPFNNKSDGNIGKPPKIAYSAMHGVGHPWAVRLFESFGLDPFLTVPEQKDADPDFPSVLFPNPEEKGALDLSMNFASSNDCDIILANDPDADRLAVAEKCRESGEWTTFTGDQIGTMLGHWIWENLGKNSDKPVAMCASTVSSKMLRAIAEAEGFLFNETLTGFKYIGSRAVTLSKKGYRPLFLYEEAIGFCCGDVVFDKDGLTAAGTMAELALRTYRNGDTLSKHMQNLYDKYGEFCSNNGYYFCHDSKVTQKIMEKIRNGGDYMKSVGPYSVKSIRDLGFPGFDSTTEDNKPTLPVSKSSPMMTIHFTNGCVAQFRASGTEPKFKYYIEMQGKPGVKRDVVERDLKKCSNTILEALLQPKENGLIEP
eukprot:CAMPEP_0203666464 /NCGR_PEP_ID=MMETSP0090-20130426/3487_1 /ASSEMBLY_ACC=CAM_ASM_001088 /TAXON_ID=426623 /ORGANISM="Chaetoceros affinis, Strain CCMP159" /LENGTH=632 /DNA_ID=CAMNT_0050530341 /DNA_START=169 /DNA_END=2067 /DNA_ORIENTATION=+